MTDNLSITIESYKENKFVTWITAILLYMMLQPYFIWSFVDSLQWIVLLPLYLIFFFNADWKKDIFYFACFFLLTLFISFNQHQNIFGLFFVVAVSIVYVAKKGFVFSVYKHFWQLYSVLITLSMISMLLISIGVPLPGVLIPPLNELKNHYYIAYPFYVTDSIGESIRFCGLFDEPGVVGTISLILLYIEKFNFKRIGNIFVLLSGLLSLSLFFYLVLGFFLVFQVFSRNTNIKNRILFFVLLVAGVGFVFKNPVTYEKIVERSVWDEEKGSISGDNRASIDLKDYMDSIRWTQEYFLGSSKDTIHEYANSASLQNAVLFYGIIVVILYFVFYALYAKSYLGLGWKWILFMLFLFVVLYNRPNMFNICRQFLYNIAIFAYSDKFSTKS